MFNRRNKKTITKEEVIELIEKEEKKEKKREKKRLEENLRYHKRNRAINIVFFVILALLALITIDVIAVGRFNKGPFFAIPVKKYKDGGTKEYYGLGYKVIKYHQVQGRRDKEIGYWSLKYDTNPTTVQDLDLAIEFTGNEVEAYKKYYKEFLRVSSTLHKVTPKKNQILLGYQDEDNKYSIDIVCKMSKDQKDLRNLEEDKEITVIGTVTNFYIGTEKENNRLVLSDCFAEQ